MTTRTGATLFFGMMVNNVPVSRETGSTREGNDSSAATSSGWFRTAPM